LRAGAGLGLALVAALAACGGDSPTEVVFEVIEDTEFAVSLGIDLAQMTELPSGVYILDEVDGTGDVIAQGDVATVDYTGWLRAGTQFDTGTYQYDYGVLNNRTPIQGWTLGMEGMAVSGTRLLIIPPALAYGAQGAGPIPPGAIVIFRVELVSLTN
jgi:FKBP-type peptidyl-prolyl cis-trans isomerase